jgi:exodeoxyribonuclease VII large subunit
MAWRNDQAKREGVETYRVFPNATLEAIATNLPKNKEEMLGIKGLKEAKFARYGSMLLAIMQEYISNEGKDVISNLKLVTGERGAQEKGMITGSQLPITPQVTNYELPITPQVTNYELPVTTDILSVSAFLDALNLGLSGMAARIRGEVSSVDIRDRVVYFSLKDSQDESLVSCLIFRSQYQISGVNIAVGDEIIIEGVPEVYKPNGRLSLKVSVIELAGEGALKKAYDELFRRLESEGLMRPEKKRSLPDFPRRIALITSEQGAAIGDFTMNLGQIGLKVDFYRSSVEGKKAVFEILAALKYFNAHSDRYDLLVLIRGGGSFESLQAFNNEMLVREVANSKIPTLLGVGHEKDVTLAALASDVMVSTPTATARTIREPFERARQTVAHAKPLLLERFDRELSEQHTVLSHAEQIIAGVFPKLRERFERMQQKLFRSFDRVSFVITQSRNSLGAFEERLDGGFGRMMETAEQSLLRLEEKLREYDPNRALALGYSLVRLRQGLVRSIGQVKQGDILDISLKDGSIETEVRSVTGNS